MHLSNELRHKLDARITLCIFIGYGDEGFEYRLSDPKTKKFIRSIDVVFHESQTLDDTEKPTMSFVLSFSAQEFIFDPALAQIATYDNQVYERIPEAEHKEE